MRAAAGTGDTIGVRVGSTPRHGPGRGVRAGMVGAVLVFVAVSLTACLPPGAVLQGRVTDVGAGPIAGVSVRVYSSATETVVASTATDADGDYSFMPEGLVDGTYRILFSEHDWWEGATGWADATDVTVADGTTRRIDVTIDAAKGSVAGTVTDGSAPLDGVTVTVRTSTDDRAVATGSTGPDGTYTVADVPVGTYRVLFALAGYTTRYSNAAPTAAAAPIVAVAGGETLNGVDTTLTSEARVTGVLTDGTDPVAGGLVVVYDLDHTAWVTHLTTGVDGAFDVANLNPGRYSIGFFDAATGTFGLYGSESDDPADGAPITVAAGSQVDLGTLVVGTAFHAPTAPVGVAATPGDTQATVSWGPPAADGGAAVTGYTVTASPGGQTCTTTETTCVVTGLTNGTPTTFAVAATNAIGQGPAATGGPVTPKASAQWQQVTPPAYEAPSQRAMPAMASLGDGRAVLYGGTGESSTPIGETWIWSNGAWSQIVPTTSPGPLAGASMAKWGNGGAVLFGGSADPSQAPSDATWIFDGTNWERQHPQHSPSPRASAAMTTLSNGNVLLYGGTGGYTEMYDDTWLFDGTTWTELDTGAAPPARTAASMAALPNGAAVLFGGLESSVSALDDTWIFEDGTWRQVETSTTPPGRAAAGTATLGDGRVVLFGGVADVDLTTPIFDETWVFDGEDWAEAEPSTVPPARYGAAMAMIADGAVVMFGGTDQIAGDVTVPNDTWVFDGTDWTRHGVPEPLPPIAAGAMATLDDGGVVLFGGADSPTYGTVYDTTWLFDGETWTNLHPATSPPARAGASMVTLSDGSVLLYGGFSPENGAFDDTWVFDGTDWVEQSPETSPPALTYTAMVATPGGGAVLFGGTPLTSMVASDATWTWDGSTWTEQTPEDAPPARLGATMAIGPDGDPVLFGGFDQNTSTLFDDTWVWDGNNWHERLPATAPPARVLASMVTLADGKVLVYGGANATLTTSFGDAWIFDGTTWTQDLSPVIPPARAGASMVARPDGSVLLIGGFDATDLTSLRDTWIRTP